MSESLARSMRMLKEFSEGIKDGNSDCGYSLAMTLLDEGPNIEPEVLVEMVECVFELSVLAGSSIALDHLEKNWKIVKPGHIRHLVRKM